MRTKQRLTAEEIRHNHTVRLNKVEKEKLEKVALKYGYKSTAEYIRHLAVYEKDPLTIKRFNAISNLNRTTNLLKALYKKNYKSSDVLNTLEIVKNQLKKIAEELK